MIIIMTVSAGLSTSVAYIMMPGCNFEEFVKQSHCSNPLLTYCYCIPVYKYLVHLFLCVLHSPCSLVVRTSTGPPQSRYFLGGGSFPTLQWQWCGGGVLVCVVLGWVHHSVHSLSTLLDTPTLLVHWVDVESETIAHLLGHNLYWSSSSPLSVLTGRCPKGAVGWMVLVGEPFSVQQSNQIPFLNE